MRDLQTLGLLIMAIGAVIIIVDRLAPLVIRRFG